MPGAPEMEWVQLHSQGTPPAPRSFAAVGWYRNMAVIHGGRDATTTFSDAHALFFSPSVDSGATSCTWVSLPLQYPEELGGYVARAYHSAAVCGNELLLLGGRDVQDNYFATLLQVNLDTVYDYVAHIVTGVGHASVHLIDVLLRTQHNALPRAYHSAMVVGRSAGGACDHMVAAGGNCAAEWCDLVSIFDLDTGEWTHYTGFPPATVAPPAAPECTCCHNAPHNCTAAMCAVAQRCVLPSVHKSHMLASGDIPVISAAANTVNSAQFHRFSNERNAPRDAPAAALRLDPNGCPRVVMHGGELSRVFMGSLLEYDVPGMRIPAGRPMVYEYSGVYEASAGPLDPSGAAGPRTAAELNAAPPCQSAAHYIAPCPRAYHHGLMVDGAFVIWGGYIDRPQTFMDDAFAFDFSTRLWRPLTQTGAIPSARCSMAHCDAELGGPGTTHLFFGGDDGLLYYNATFLARVRVARSLRQLAAAWLAESSVLPQAPSPVENTKRLPCFPS